MALGKASLVAMFFMHLRFERLTLGVIAFTPLIICVFLVFMLTPDLGAIAHKTTVPAKQTTGAKHSFPLPATASAEGRQFSGAPSLWGRGRVRGFSQWHAIHH